MLVLLPENFALFGERQGYLDGAEPLGNGPIQQQLSDWAKSHGIWLVAGAMPTAVQNQEELGAAQERMALTEGMSEEDLEAMEAVKRIENAKFLAQQLVEQNMDQAIMIMRQWLTEGEA